MSTVMSRRRRARAGTAGTVHRTCHHHRDVHRHRSRHRDHCCHHYTGGAVTAVMTTVVAAVVVAVTAAAAAVVTAATAPVLAGVVTGDRCNGLGRMRRTARVRARGVAVVIARLGMVRAVVAVVAGEVPGLVGNRGSAAGAGDRDAGSEHQLRRCAEASDWVKRRSTGTAWCEPGVKPRHHHHQLGIGGRARDPA